ncbi:hypothetical protein FB45DRAFT_917595 [Roridomyces roridus]|uniref:Uncharacterized protein n=1 Tax=Roridomyces roridus TaxID=1738132 RepID=A0AAD7BUT1_9AGAR|nr:hypothetical protein FB45DRAFT_917595 [Roridomyces roridus]
MSGIFNVQEPEHLSEFQTTAAQAQAEAQTSTIAREVEENAEHVKDVAHDAANAALKHGQSLTGQTAGDRLQNDASLKTSAAIEEGRANVEEAKATGATYLDQAKSLAANAAATAQTAATTAATTAVETAQAYLPPPSGADGKHTASDVVTGLQNAGTAAYATTKEYLAAAQTTAQPHIEKARDVAASYLPAGAHTTQTAPVSMGGKDTFV